MNADRVQIEPGIIESKIEFLRHVLEKTWSTRTSSDPDWSPARPSRGQCAVTALVVQDEFGGSLLRCVNVGSSHYWNRLRNGRELDLTRDQFAVWYPGSIETRTRELVCSNPDTFSRYTELRAQVDELL